MRYLVVQDWDNTHGNHAGMVHMCNLLAQNYPSEYKVLVKACPRSLKKRGASIWERLLSSIESRRLVRENGRGYIDLLKPYVKSMCKGDEVFLLEYNLHMVNQYPLACYIKKIAPFVKVYALSHLTPTWLNNDAGTIALIKKWDKVIDKHLTLGTSLTEFFCSIGIDKSRISTGFHYVDKAYYQKGELEVHRPLTIICIGALQRDFTMLSQIVRGCKNVNWIICKGRKNVDDLFADLGNVKLLGYLEEDELRRNMSIADISLNVLEDTVGSNVITTSMAMGLAIVVSDVGSIRNYCDETNAVFCENNDESFVGAINRLVNMQDEKLRMMKEASIIRTNALGIDKVHEWFCGLKA